MDVKIRFYCEVVLVVMSVTLGYLHTEFKARKRLKRAEERAKYWKSQYHCAKGELPEPDEF